MTVTGERLLTTAEVCAHLRVSRDKLQELRDQGEMPATKVGGQYRYWPNDVRLFLERGRVPVRSAS